MNALLLLAARHGRIFLILGLLAGIGLPDLALALKPWIGEMIAFLMFLAALRIGPRQAVGAARDLRWSVVLVLVYQLVLPMVLVGMLLGLGWTGPLAMAVVLALAASPITGSPNITMMTGHDPAPALRQLIVGTALLPLTVLPVFWLVLKAALRLLLIILLATGSAFLLHARFMRRQDPRVIGSIDGLSAIVLGIVVIGLMSAVGPAILADPIALVLNLGLAFAVNFPLQIAVALGLHLRGKHRIAVPLAIVAGNRNMALFLTALPMSVMDPMLLFIGCYQIPMYLTPLLLGKLYRHIAEPGPRNAASAM